MNAPYMGKFKVSQEFKGASVHDGLDLVGLDSKEIHCVKAGKVIFAGWENASNHKQGFGQYVKVQVGDDIWYYGHLSKINVNVGQTVKVTDIIGIEGSTGHSTGSHLHICVRPKGIKANALNVASVLNIPNKIGVYDDGYGGKTTTATTESKSSNSTSAKSFDNAISGTYKTTAKLNFRESPNGKIITVLPEGTSVRCYGYYTDGWYSVTCNGKNGFVAKQYLTKA